jgi:hypothetical protein
LAEEKFNRKLYPHQIRLDFLLHFFIKKKVETKAFSKGEPHRKRTVMVQFEEMNHACLLVARIRNNSNCISTHEYHGNQSLNFLLTLLCFYQPSNWLEHEAIISNCRKRRDRYGNKN